MSHQPAALLERPSPMPMVCPLVKLGRSSPPTADQGYHTALESSQVCHSTDSPENYNILRPNTLMDQQYHGSKPHFSDIYHQDLSINKGDPLGDMRPKAAVQKTQKTQKNFDYEARNSPNIYITNNNPSLYRLDTMCPHQLADKLQYCSICEQSSNHSSSSLDCEQSCAQKYYSRNSSNAARNYYQNKALLERRSAVSNNDRFWKKSDHINDFYNRNSKDSEATHQSYSCNYLVDNFNKLGKASPNLDQGYHTLVSPSPGPSMTNPWAEGALNPIFKGKKVYLKNNSFDKLSDELMLKIFSWLHSHDLSSCARVCRRFEALAWRPCLWRTITLYGENVSGDRAIRGVLRQLCGQGRTGACPSIEKVYLSDGVKLTDRGLTLLARRCPELTHLQTHGCADITNFALYEMVMRCTNLQHLDITGCTNVSCITVIPGPEPPRRLLLQYLDLTDCSSIEDNGLRVIVRNCPQLVYLYLRRCVQITDAGLKNVPSYCLGLRELSVSDCGKVTDFGLYELAKLGATLRYLSVAKCDQVSDAGLKVIARRCYKLRYLNARGCEAVSDDAITVLARSCTRLRALDIGKCDVSDAGLRALAESCPNIKKLSLRNCDLVTDRGVQCIAYYCRGLQQLNIQDCQISLEGYRAVKKYCKRCIIEHTNPGYF